MAFGGMKLEALAEDARRTRNLSADDLALEVMHVGQYGKHRLAKNAGFRKGDVIIEVDGSRTPMTESNLMGKILTDYRTGSQIPVVVLRGSEEVKLKLPTQ